MLPSYHICWCSGIRVATYMILIWFVLSTSGKSGSAIDWANTTVNTQNNYLVIMLLVCHHSIAVLNSSVHVVPHQLWNMIGTFNVISRKLNWISFAQRKLLDTCSMYHSFVPLCPCYHHSTVSCRWPPSACRTISNRYSGQILYWSYIEVHYRVKVVWTGGHFLRNRAWKGSC